MARFTYRLTAVKVEALEDKGLYPDGDGLYLRVTSTGTKSWIYRYAQAGTTRDMGLGPLAGVPSLKPAGLLLMRAGSGRRDSIRLGCARAAQGSEACSGAGHAVHAAAKLAIPLTVVDIASEEARNLYSTDLALIRPDQMVAWRGNEQADPVAVLRRATGHLQ